MVRTTNTPANHLVARANRASNDFDLFLVKKVSDPPLSAPDKPEVLPDWNIMIAISTTHTIRCIITNTVFKAIYPFFIPDNETIKVETQRLF
jgi:hypothetical protein